MGESSKFERPANLEKGSELFTPEEQFEMTLNRSEYLLAHIAKQDEQIGIDHLTGLKTREFLVNELERALKAIYEKEEWHHRAGGESLKEVSLIFVDLDNFKQVNDTHGHLEGDKVLKRVAEILTKSVRGADVVARFGGDEFYVFLPRANKEDGEAIADKIQANLENDLELKEFNVTASIGVSSADASNPIDSITLIKHADEAAIAAKNAGKNRVEVYKENEYEPLPTTSE